MENKGELRGRLEGPEYDAARKEGLAFRQGEFERSVEAHKYVTGYLTHKHFDGMLETIYQLGGNPEVVYTTLEQLYKRGYIDRWEYTWRRALRWLRIPQPNIRFRRMPHLGTLKLSETSGARSVRRTAGTKRTG